MTAIKHVGKIYKPEIKDHIRLWWHLLTNLHRQCSRKDSGVLSWIACYECNGKPDFDSDFFMKGEK